MIVKDENVMYQVYTGHIKAARVDKVEGNSITLIPLAGVDPKPIVVDVSQVFSVANFKAIAKMQARIEQLRSELLVSRCEVAKLKFRMKFDKDVKSCPKLLPAKAGG